MSGTWFQNGTVSDSIAINDRGVQYGDGLFETVAVRGGDLRLWSLHADRLQITCRKLGIDAPSSDELLQQSQACLLATQYDAGDALLKLIVTRGVGPRGYAAPVGIPPTVLIGVFARTCWPASHYEAGIRIRYCQARLSLQPQTAGMKLLSRLDQVRARGEWQDENVAEGLMLAPDGSVVCGTMSNLFIVKDGLLLTPQTTQCGVSGVMRQHILAITDQHGIDCEVTTINAEAIEAADEIFLCNSQYGIWPVAHCAQKSIECWPMTRRVMGLLRQSGVIEGPE